MIGSAVGMALVIAAGVRDALSRYGAEEPAIELDTCCDSGDPRRAPQASVPANLGGGVADRGVVTYRALCANCHDPDGSGRRGRVVFPGVPNLRGATAVQTATVVVHGRGTMPAFGGLVTDGELRDLLAYVERLQTEPY